jgi:hypothetical protein
MGFNIVMAVIMAVCGLLCLILYNGSYSEEQPMVLLQTIILAAGFAASFILNKLGRARITKAYVDYYAKKRREFSWLENWIKENENPAEGRAVAVTSGGLFLVFLYFLVVEIITMIIPSMFGLKKSIPFQIILLAAGIVVYEITSRKSAKNPGIEENANEKGLTLECPSCHCPHAWVMTQKEEVVEGSNTSRTETTTTTKTKYGDDSTAASALFSGTKTDTETTYKETTTYYGKTIRDFKCLNCGHTGHIKYSDSWSYEPKGGIQVFNPPKPALGIEEESRKEKLRKGQKQQKIAGKSYEKTKKAGGKMSIAEMHKAMDNGSIEAKRDLVVAYFLGLGVEKDEEKAKAIAEVVFVNDYKKTFKSVLSEKGYEAYVAKNYDIAFPLYQKAAELNDDFASLKLARFYHHGYGVAQDKKKAYELYQSEPKLLKYDDEAQKALKQLKKELK